MRIGIIGRTRPLLRTADALRAEGHDISFVYTCASEPYYHCETAEFQEYAAQCGVPFYNDSLITTRLESLQSTNTDICVSINWISVLPQQFLHIFPLGILNGHPGDLPRYRGNACPNWAILNGETEVGMSIHLMTAELDAGPIYMKEMFEISGNSYIGDFMEWHEDVTPTMFVKVIRGLDEGSIVAEPQDLSIGTIRTFPRRPSDSRIDWRQSPQAIHRLIRASSLPFDGSFAVVEDGRRITIYRAEIVPVNYRFHALPGQICEIQSGCPLVACGSTDKLLLLTDFVIDELSSAESHIHIAKSLRARLF